MELGEGEHVSALIENSSRSADGALSESLPSPLRLFHFFNLFSPNLAVQNLWLSSTSWVWSYRVLHMVEQNADVDSIF